MEKWLKKAISMTPWGKKMIKREAKPLVPAYKVDGTSNAITAQQLANHPMGGSAFSGTDADWHLSRFEMLIRTQYLPSADLERNKPYQFCVEVFDYLDTSPLVNRVVGGDLDAEYSGHLSTRMRIYFEMHERMLYKVIKPYFEELCDAGRNIVIDTDVQYKCASELTIMCCLYMRNDH